MDDNSPTACFNLFSSVISRPPHIVTFNNDEARCIGINTNGTDMTFEQLVNIWNTINCNQVFFRLYFPPGGGLLVFNPQQFEFVQQDMEYLLSKYFNQLPEGHTLALPGQEEYNPFQDVLIQSCTGSSGIDTNGICNKGLQTLCNQCSRGEIANNTNLLRLCGCYAPELDPETFPGISRQCDSLCAQARVAQIRNPTTGEVMRCDEGGICVINTVSITASKSSVGDTQFNQVCPMCVNTPSCKCIVDITIASNTEQVGIGTPFTFNQHCGENSQCIIINNQTQAVETVPCPDVNLEAETFHFPVPIGIWIIILILIILFFIVVYALKYAYREDYSYVVQVPIIEEKP